MQSHQKSKTYSLVMPVALTQLYLQSIELSPTSSKIIRNFECIFEDDPQKISQMQPDLTITMTNSLSQSRQTGEREIIVRRLIVASPSLFGKETLTSLIELERFPYATLEPLGCRYFFLKTPSNETMVIEPKTSFRSNNMFAAHEAAKHGIAFAVLPKFLVQEDIRSGKLISLFPNWPPQPYLINAVIAKTCLHQKKIRSLADSLMERIQTIPGVEMRKW